MEEKENTGAVPVGSWGWALAQAQDGEVVWRAGWDAWSEAPGERTWLGWHQEAVTMYAGDRVLGRFSPNERELAATDWRSSGGEGG